MVSGFRRLDSPPLGSVSSLALSFLSLSKDRSSSALGLSGYGGGTQVQLTLRLRACVISLQGTHSSFLALGLLLGSYSLVLMGF